MTMMQSFLRTAARMGLNGAPRASGSDGLSLVSSRGSLPPRTRSPGACKGLSQSLKRKITPKRQKKPPRQRPRQRRMTPRRRVGAVLPFWVFYLVVWRLISILITRKDWHPPSKETRQRRKETKIKAKQRRSPQSVQGNVSVQRIVWIAPEPTSRLSSLLLP